MFRSTQLQGVRWIGTFPPQSYSISAWFKSYLLYAAKELWLVYENHATVHLNRAALLVESKLTAKAELNCEIYKSERAAVWDEKLGSLPWILQELKNTPGNENILNILKETRPILARLPTGEDFSISESFSKTERGLALGFFYFSSLFNALIRLFELYLFPSHIKYDLNSHNFPQF